jgi:hypothetical protein
MRILGLILIAITAATILTFVFSGSATRWFVRAPWKVRLSFALPMFLIIPAMGVTFIAVTAKPQRPPERDMTCADEKGTLSPDGTCVINIEVPHTSSVDAGAGTYP